MNNKLDKHSLLAQGVFNGNSTINTLRNPIQLFRSQFNLTNFMESRLLSIYIHPGLPNVTGVVFEGEITVNQLHIHINENEELVYESDQGHQHLPLEANIHAQIEGLLQKFIQDNDIAHVLYGTGDPNEPTLLDSFHIPLQWADRKEFYFQIEKYSSPDNEWDVITSFDNRSGGILSKKYYKQQKNGCRIHIIRQTRTQTITVRQKNFKRCIQQEVERDARYYNIPNKFYQAIMSDFLDRYL